MKSDSGDVCPCGKQNKFSDCCGRFLSGEQTAKTPEQLMRSRYTAHVLGGYGEYLVGTWLAAKELGLTAASFAEHKVNWQKLDVLDSVQRGDYGEVEFKAYFYADLSPASELQVMHERSVFKRIQNIWYYVEALHQNPV